MKNLKLFNQANEANLKLINQFCNEFLDDDEKEDLEATKDRIVGWRNVTMINTTNTFMIDFYYFSLSDIMQYYILNCSLEDFIDYHDYSLEQYRKNETTLNLKHWLIKNKKKFDKN